MRAAILEKQKKVEELTNKAKNYKFIGLVHIEKVPADLIQRARKELNMEMIVTKKCIIARVFKNLGLEIDEELISKPSALIFSNEPPSKIYNQLEEICIYVPPKIGSVVDTEIVIPKGETPLTMGPQTTEIIAKMKKLGIKTKNVKGKVNIEEEFTILKPGDKVTADIYTILDALEIRPIKINLKMKMAYENGLIYDEEVLSLTKDKIISMIEEAKGKALGVAYGIKYPTKETIESLVSEAKGKALSVAVNINYLTKETAEQIIGRAKGIAEKLKEKIPEQ